VVEQANSEEGNLGGGTYESTEGEKSGVFIIINMIMYWVKTAAELIFSQVYS